MRDLLYVGTDGGVSAANTKKLLSTHAAIWCPPMHMKVEPEMGDRIWLVWKTKDNPNVDLLGGGTLAASPRGKMLWTERDLPGLRDAARDLGYGGPANMAFLVVEGAPVLSFPSTALSLPDAKAGLQHADEAVAKQLGALLHLGT